MCTPILAARATTRHYAGVMHLCNKDAMLHDRNCTMLPLLQVVWWAMDDNEEINTVYGVIIYLPLAKALQYGLHIRPIMLKDAMVGTCSGLVPHQCVLLIHFQLVDVVLAYNDLIL